MNTAKIILYADDDLDDKDWVREASKVINSSLQIKFVENGRDVLNYLKLSPDELPSLIVLDLNMPELDGRQTLKVLKSNPAYKKIPVAVVTTSSSKLDMDVCKKLGASLFLTKPNSFREWENILKTIEPFALNKVC